MVSTACCCSPPPALLLTAPRAASPPPPATRPQGQPASSFNLAFTLPFLVDQKSYPPDWTAPEQAAPGEPAARGGVFNYRAGIKNPAQVQSVNLTTKVRGRGPRRCGERRGGVGGLSSCAGRDWPAGLAVKHCTAHAC